MLRPSLATSLVAFLLVAPAGAQPASSAPATAPTSVPSAAPAPAPASAAPTAKSAAAPTAAPAAAAAAPAATPATPATPVAPAAAPAARPSGAYPSPWDTVTVMARLGEQLGREAFPALLVVEGGYACLPGARGAAADCAARRRAAIVAGTYLSPRIVQLAAAAPAAIVIDGDGGAWSARFFEAQGGDPCTGACVKPQRVIRRAVVQAPPRFARDTALIEVAEYLLRPGYPEQVVPEIARYTFVRTYAQTGWQWKFARRVLTIAE